MAGGQWRLPIPFVAASFAITTDGTLVSPLPLVTAGISGSVSPITNLLQIDGPTLLTEWDLESIYLPVTIGLAPAQNAAQIALTAFLTVNGSLVWQQQQQTVSGSVSSPGATFADDFINPITVKRADVLGLSFSATAVGTPVNAVTGTFGTRENASGRLGQIGYSVQEIPGRRRL